MKINQKIFRTLSDGHNWNSKKIKTWRQKWSNKPWKTNGNQIKLPFRRLVDLVRTTGWLSICSQILQERSSNWPIAQALHLLSPQSQAHPFKQRTQRMSGTQRPIGKKDGKPEPFNAKQIPWRRGLAQRLALCLSSSSWGRSSGFYFTKNLFIFLALVAVFALSSALPPPTTWALS